jgi:molecular chaperone DnaK (HSP70)
MVILTLVEMILTMKLLWLADEFKTEEGIDLRLDPMSLQRLKEAAEKQK